MYKFQFLRNIFSWVGLMEYKYLKYKHKYLKHKIGGAMVNDPTEKLEPIEMNFIRSLNKKNDPPLSSLTPDAARKVLDDLQAGAKIDVPTEKSEIKFPAGEKYSEFSVYIVRPKTSDVLPGIIYVHGAGWILGNYGTHERIVREIAYGANVAVVFVNYSLSPEAPFPVAVEQSFAALKFIGENGAKHKIDTSKLMIAGDSVGGDMATVVARLAKDRGGPKLVYQILMYPVTDASMSTNSYKEFANGPWLTAASMAWFWDAYEPNKEKRKDSLLSPLNATLEELKNLPPALVITNENDVLRDEGEAYAHKLIKAGVQTVAVRFLGVTHDFLMLKPYENSPIRRSAMEFIIMNIKHKLS